MARFNEGLLGPFSGKVGPVVGATWMGKPIMRSAPKKSTKPRTPAQLRQSERLRVTERFLNPLSFLIKTSFSLPRLHKTARNAATSYTMKYALDDRGEQVKIVYSKVLVSNGELREIDGAQAMLLPENTLQLTWQDNSNQGLAYADDVLFVVVYAPQLHEYHYFLDASSRQDGTALLDLPESFAGQEMHCWASFRNEGTGQTSDSRYVVLL